MRILLWFQECFTGSKFQRASLLLHSVCSAFTISRGIYQELRKVCSHSSSKIRKFRCFYSYKEIVSGNPLSKMNSASLKLDSPYCYFQNSQDHLASIKGIPLMTTCNQHSQCSVLSQGAEGFYLLPAQKYSLDWKSTVYLLESCRAGGKGSTALRFLF